MALVSNFQAVVIRADEEWVAAVIGPDHVQGTANPFSDYEPALPAPCRGRLRSDRPAIVSEIPTGHVACVGDDLIVSETIC
jgi:hypothetical protein